MRFFTKTRSRRTLAFSAIGPAVFAALAGCQHGLQSVDRRVDKLVEERTSSLLGATVTPQLTGRLPARSPMEGMSGILDERTPPTTDPAAAELTFIEAPADRDVAARLREFAAVDASQATVLSLDAALAQAQQTSREYADAQDAYLLASINLLVERHLWGPRFFASTSAIATATGTDGNFASPLNLINELRATQRLPSGGEVEARWVWNATEQLRQTATGRYTQASSLVLSGNLPLLRGAGMVAREDLTQAERDLVYAARRYETARRDLLVDIAREFFSLQQQQRSIANQERALELLRRLERRTGALVEAGRLAEFQRNIAASDVLRGEARLADQRERFILGLDRFKVRLGVPVGTVLTISPDVVTLPEPLIEPSTAAEAALGFRLDLQTQRDRLIDANRRVANARDGLLPDADLVGSATFRTKPGVSEGGVVYEAGDAIYQGGVQVNWPLDRQQEALATRRAQIEAERSKRDLDALVDTVVLDARASVREIERARFSLELQKRAVQINLRRAKEQEIKADEVTAQQVVDTANALRDAENARDQARTDLSNAVLNHLRVTGQLRVTRDGLLQLPGASGQ
jgi:outer membrane protein TolC